MHVDETGQDRASLQIDFPGCHARARVYSLLGPNRFDSAVSHRQCGRNVTVAVHRDEVAVAEYDVGGRAIGGHNGDGKANRY
jgi:hypothetical protein